MDLESAKWILQVMIENCQMTEIEKGAISVGIQAIGVAIGLERLADEWEARNGQRRETD